MLISSWVCRLYLFLLRHLMTRSTHRHEDKMRELGSARHLVKRALIRTFMLKILGSEPLRCVGARQCCFALISRADSQVARPCGTKVSCCCFVISFLPGQIQRWSATYGSIARLSSHRAGARLGVAVYNIIRPFLGRPGGGGFGVLKYAVFKFNYALRV